MNKKTILPIILLVVVAVGISSGITYKVMNNKENSAVSQLNNQIQNYKKAIKDLDSKNTDLSTKNQELYNETQTLMAQLGSYYTKSKK